jgi:hypothetical protein
MKTNVAQHGLENLLLIGDVHGKIDNYWKILQKHKGNSIQLGDFGFKEEHQWHLKNIDNTKHQIVFGNHDDYTFFDKPHSLFNYSYSPETQLMTIRGANSIDKYKRIENRDWWANEEMNYQEMQEAVDFYCDNKPRIVVSHNCPREIAKHFWSITDKSTTTNGLQIMFECHQPELWFFGHHHRSVNETINNTRFICLAELETFKF